MAETVATDKDNEFADGFALKAHANASPLLVFRYEDYAENFAQEDVSEETRQAQYEALKELVINLVRFGYGVHPIDQALDDKEKGDAGCGELANSDNESPLNGPDMLYLQHKSLNGKFDHIAMKEKEASDE